MIISYMRSMVTGHPNFNSSLIGFNPYAVIEQYVLIQMKKRDLNKKDHPESYDRIHKRCEKDFHAAAAGKRRYKICA